MTAVLITCIAGVAVANWLSRYSGRSLWEEITKPTVTVLVIVLAATGHEAASARLFAVVALTLCLVGDVALLPRFDRFVVGLGAFLLGHLVFIPMFLVLGWENTAMALAALVVVAAVAAFVGRPIVRAAARSDARLRAPVALYLAVISAMGVVAWGHGRASAVVGAVAFVLSDALLGWNRFVRPRRWMTTAVMVTYHVAITALALSVR